MLKTDDWTAGIPACVSHNSNTPEYATAATQNEPVPLPPQIDPQIVKTGPMTGLKRAINAYDKEIFIEQESERGKPRIWYSFDNRGAKKRWERDTCGIAGSTITDPTHRAAYQATGVEHL